MNLNNLKKYTIRQKITNLILFFVIVLGALIYFAIMPSVSEINELKKKIINEKINSEKKYQTEKNIISLNKKINEIAPDIKNLEEVFVNQNRELEFITILENLANKNNIKQKINLSAPIIIPSAKTSKTSKKTETKETALYAPLTIETTGSYKDTISYLTELNALKYYINIDSLSFSGSSVNSSLPEDNLNNNKIISLNIIAKTYWK